MREAAVRRLDVFFRETLDGAQPAPDAAVRAAVSVYDFALAYPEDARLVAELRLEDMFDEQLAALSRRLFGNSGPTALERTTFAVVDIACGAVHRHLLAGKTPPAALRPWIEAAVRSALKEPASSTAQA